MIANICLTRYSDYLTLLVLDSLQRALFEQSQPLCANQTALTTYHVLFLGLSHTDTKPAAKYKNTLKTTMQTSVALPFLPFLLKSAVPQLNEPN